MAGDRNGGVGMTGRFIKWALAGKGIGVDSRQPLRGMVGRSALRLFCPDCFNERPILATYAVTENCPWNCLHCSRTQRGEGELPFDTLAEVIKKIIAMGTPIHALTGGEPLLRRDIKDIVSLIEPPANCQIYTTGAGLTPDMASFLASRGNVSVYVSLLSRNAEAHDAVRRKPGSYKTALEAINNLKNAGAHVGVATIATKKLFEEGIIDFLKELKEMGVQQVLVFEPKLTGSILDEEDAMIGPEERRIAASLHGLEKRREDVPEVFSFLHVEGPDMLGCSAGYCRVYIDARGNVGPCDFVPLSFGNITEEPFEKIWDRMHGCFNRPRRECFINTHHREIKEMASEGLPLPPEKSLELCKRHPPKEPYPGIYSALGFNPDLSILSDLDII